MKTVGQAIANVRKKKGITVADLSQKTKIKPEFIKAIEAESWSKLPEFPVVCGFVKNISSYLDMNQDHLHPDDRQQERQGYYYYY